MENYLVYTFNEMMETSYSDLESTKKDYGEAEIFGCFLEYEGIYGYTSKILRAIDLIREKQQFERRWKWKIDISDQLILMYVEVNIA